MVRPEGELFNVFHLAVETGSVDLLRFLLFDMRISIASMFNLYGSPDMNECELVRLECAFTLSLASD